MIIKNNNGNQKLICLIVDSIVVYRYEQPQRRAGGPRTHIEVNSVRRAWACHRLATVNSNKYMK